jgi:hypothetical protein
MPGPFSLGFYYLNKTAVILVLEMKLKIAENFI